MHWDHDPRLPPTAYVYRDGRDVMVSLLNHHMRQITTRRHPRGGRQDTGSVPASVRTVLRPDAGHG